MILSFHPIIEVDRNIICAGREPDKEDLAAIRAADAVILPQGCPEALYRMAQQHCPLIFPNLDVRFDYTGKRGQIRLFERYGVEHPGSLEFDTLADFHRNRPRIEYPAVVKFDWGGEGDTVFEVTDEPGMTAVLARAEAFEATGQRGFLIQRYIETGGRSLRVVVIGTRFISYWRIQAPDASFGTSVADGAAIDKLSDPHLRSAAVEATMRFCRKTGLQLAGMDFIFDSTGAHAPQDVPLMLEINYYFGRTGLGGSQAYYRILSEEVEKWLAGVARSS